MIRGSLKSNSKKNEYFEYLYKATAKKGLFPKHLRTENFKPRKKHTSMIPVTWSQARVPPPPPSQVKIVSSPNFPTDNSDSQGSILPCYGKERTWRIIPILCGRRTAIVSAALVLICLLIFWPNYETCYIFYKKNTNKWSVRQTENIMKETPLRYKNVKLQHRRGYENPETILWKKRSPTAITCWNQLLCPLLAGRRTRKLVIAKWLQTS